MENILLYGTASVTIQGPRVLRFLSRERDHAVYDVIGFEEKVFVYDYRSQGLEAIQRLLETDDCEQFAYKFNTPAYVVIEQQSEDRLVITLQDTYATQPPNMLWIAIGLKGNLPLYDYLFDYVIPFDHNSLAVIALYKRPAVAYPTDVVPHSSSSVTEKGRYRSSSDISVRPISSGLY